VLVITPPGIDKTKGQVSVDTLASKKGSPRGAVLSPHSLTCKLHYIGLPSITSASDTGRAGRSGGGQPRGDCLAVTTGIALASLGARRRLDALARGDSAGALRLLRVATDSLRANGGANAWITAPLDLEVGKLLLSAGRLDQAEPRLLGVTASPWLRVLGEWYLGRLAELRGDPAATREHYGRVVRWWHDCDPELRPLWEEARRRLTHVRSNVAAANRQT
jgi:hypothetical protein